MIKSGDSKRQSAHMMQPSPARTANFRDERSLVRRIISLIRERRLPYRVSQCIDRLCVRCGLLHKTVREQGLTFHVRRQTCDELFVQNIVVNREYNPPGFEIGETDTVIDIGGNIGTFAVFAAKCASRGRVFAFEPEEANFSLLCKNIRRNGATNITAKRLAVASERKTVKLSVSGQGGFHSIAEGRATTQVVQSVDAIGLRDVFEEFAIERCHFLKIDCEGAEYEILYSTPAQYFERINRIAMEYHAIGDFSKRREQSDELVAFLERMGFSILAYEEFVGFNGGFIRAERRVAQ
jgi:FkbM family methyltransferase